MNYLTIILLDFIKNNRGAILGGSGVLGLITWRASYLNSIAPCIVITEIDCDKREIFIENVGKGLARNIKFSTLSHMWKLDVPQESKLIFKAIAYLKPNEPQGLDCSMSTSSFSKPRIAFAHNIRNQQREFFIEYEDKDGHGYISKQMISGSGITVITTGNREWKFVRLIRNGVEFFKYRWQRRHIVQKMRTE